MTRLTRDERRERRRSPRAAAAIAAAAVMAVAMLGAASPAVGARPLSPPPASPDDSAEVVRTVTRFHDALARGDSAAALALLAPDATVLESGDVESLAEYRAHHLPADIEFARAVQGERGPVRATVRGDAAWTVATSRARGTFRGRAVDSGGVELMVLTRTAAGWRIAAIHWSSRRRGG